MRVVAQFEMDLQPQCHSISLQQEFVDGLTECGREQPLTELVTNLQLSSSPTEGQLQDKTAVPSY